MKRLKDFTKEELVNITDDQFNELIDLECMIEGAPLAIEEPRYAEVPEIPHKDVPIFSVCGYDFTDESEAREIATAIANSKSRVCLDYDYSVGYEHRYVSREKCGNVEIETKEAYSKGVYKTIKPILELRKNTIDANNEIREEYEERKEARQSIAEKINGAINEAREDFHKLEDAIQLYKRYLELSDGDEETAKKFFMDNPFYNDLLNEVLMKVAEKEDEE